MPVTGVFSADFSNFDKAVTESQAKLAGFEGASKQVESSLRLMTASQEKILNQIGAAGGRIQDAGAAAGAASSLIGGLSEKYKGVDQAMAAVGLHIGPQVKGLLELGTAASAGAASLGVLGTAGAVFASAMAGWKIGRMISDFLGLDAAIQGAAESLGLIGSVAGETAAAKQDTINLAISKGAAETINYANAVKYLAEQGQIANDKQINWTETLAATHKELRGLSDAKKAEIAIAIEAGATTEQLTNKYGLSAGALELLATRTREAAAASEELTRKKEAEAAALEKAYAQLMSDVKNANQLAIMEADAAALTAANFNKKAEAGAAYMRAVEGEAKKTTEAATAATAYATEQEALTAANDALWLSVEQTGEAHAAAGQAAAEGTAQTIAGYQGVAQQVEITSDGVRGWLELMRATNAANALLNQNSLFTTGSTLENQSRLGTAFSPIPGFASGIENFEGGLARVHGGEVLANLPRGTSVIPRGGGLGAQISNTFNLVDSESNLAKRVAEMIMRQIRAGTQLGTT